MKTIYLILSICCTLLANGANKQDANGWYFITDSRTNAFSPSPIVTVADFEMLRIDSLLNTENTMTYVLTGKVKAGKIKTWADATEKATGKQIGFLYNGKIITAPQVNMKIENGNFLISSPELIEDREKILTIFEQLKKEMK